MHEPIVVRLYEVIQAIRRKEKLGTRVKELFLDANVGLEPTTYKVSTCRSTKVS